MCYIGVFRVHSEDDLKWTDYEPRCVARHFLGTEMLI